VTRPATYCAVAIAAAALASGCEASASHRHGDVRGRDLDSTVEIVESNEEPDWNAPLPANVCYVASKNYEVEIGALSSRGDALCDRLAREYFPNEPRMHWPPPYLRSGNPDLVPTLVCVLSRGRERVSIKRGPADSDRIDADSICECLISEGWNRRPEIAALDLP
jgi:hypothetical protein